MKKADLKKLKIVVLKGGLSKERKVSLLTGAGIAAALRANGHNVTEIDLNTRDFSAVLKANPDVVVNGLHGTYGEDGIVQGILEFYKIPYTGCGVLASALVMDKVKSKEIMLSNNIPTPAFQVLDKKNGLGGLKLKYPLYFKPVDNGSSVGVFLVKNKKEAQAAVKAVLKIGRAVLVEKYIKGVEISLPVLNKKVLPVIEIVPKNEFYDYDAKYTAGKSTHIIPARLSKKDMENAKQTALKTASALMCEEYVRVDIIVSKGVPYVLEANTLPGMTPTSLFPESAKAAGISFYQLLLILIEGALKKKNV